MCKSNKMKYSLKKKHYDEEKFKNLLQTTDEINISILYCNIRSITNKHDDFVEKKDCDSDSDNDNDNYNNQ